MVTKDLGQDFFPMKRLQQFIPGQTPTRPQEMLLPSGYQIVNGTLMKTFCWALRSSTTGIPIYSPSKLSSNRDGLSCPLC